MSEKDKNTNPNKDEGEGTEDVELHGNVYPASTEPSSKEESDDDVQAHMKNVAGGTGKNVATG